MADQRGCRIGLTGGIGSGKSTVARMLVERGASLVDADAISRELTAAGGHAIAAIALQFGERAISSSGAMDRDFMRSLVFDQPAARQQLEAIIHPLVSLEAARQAENASLSGNPCTLFDIPLLVESGRWRKQLDTVLVVDCDEQTQQDRVVAREAARQSPAGGWTPEAVRKVMSGQASRSDRLAAADLSIFNDGVSMHALGVIVAKLAFRLGL